MKSRVWRNYRKDARSIARALHIDPLESRQLLAAHIVGDPTFYSTIQAAVNAAAPRAIINVDAGTYSESVTINKPLTVRGAQAGVDARSNLRQSGANESVIKGISLGTTGQSNSFYIAANDVTIDGFTVQGETNQSTSTGAGIVIAPNIAGAHIFNNIVQNNVAGLFLANGSSNDPAIIQYNVFRNNNNAGSDGGRGIYTDGGISGGNLTNVLIDSNFFYNNHGTTGTTTLEGAIALESRTANSQSNITITNNAFDANGKAVLAYNSTLIDIERNVATFSRDYYSGVLRFEGGVSNVTIRYNTLYRNPGPAIRVDQKAYAGDNFGFVVTNNNIYGNDYQYAPSKTGLSIDAGQYQGATFDATNNWWGSASGPSGDGPGTGDGITAHGNPITFSPWATSPTTTLDTPYFGTPDTLAAPIQAEDFDAGGEGIGDHNTATTNAGGTYRYSNNVGIGVSNDAGAGYYVGWTTPGEWLNYTVNAPTAGTYKIDFRISNGQTTAGTFHLEIDGVNVTGAMTANPTGAWGTWTTVSKTGVALNAGVHVLRLVMDSAGSTGAVANFNWIRFTNTAPAPVPTAPSNLTATLNGSYVNLAWTDNSTNETGFIVEREIGTSGTWQQLTITGANVSTFTDSTAAGGTTYTYRVRATNSAGDSANSNLASATTPAVVTTYVSDLPFATTPINGWGPVERDMSNGGQNAGDGNILTLNGVTYPKGLGVHAISDATFNLNGSYTQFLSDIGIDDEEAAGGSVIFQVFADGTQIYQSPIMTATSVTQHIALNVGGVKQLRLHVDDAGDGNTYDHADWAGARLTAAPITIVLATPSNLAATVGGSNQINLTWTDNGSNEGGFLIERSTDGINFTQIASVGPTQANYADNSVLAGKTYTYRVRATANGALSGYSNTASAITPAPVVQTYLSDLPWASATVGWGSIQKDLSIKGTPITLRGVTYPKGIGTHAVSNITYNLNGQYSTFASDVGVDDDTNGQGAVDFQVIGDGKVLFDSGVLTGTSAIVHINISVAGVQQLTLVANNGVAGSIDYDHADWAGAMLTTGGTTTTTLKTAALVTATLPSNSKLPVAPTNLKLVSAAPKAVKLSWTDNSKNETGFVIERMTANGRWIKIATTRANATTFTDKTAKAGATYAYRVVAKNRYGYSAYSNIVNVKTPLVKTTLSNPTTLF